MKHLLMVSVVVASSLLPAFAQKTPFVGKEARLRAQARKLEPLKGFGSAKTNELAKAAPGDEIVALAVSQEGRGPEEVGKELEKERNDLSGYVKSGEAWCSEFVSWSYKTAGYPFSQGRKWEWMLSNSNEIKNWYLRNGDYVARTDSEWRKFQPKPGDFIRYNNDRGGHSGIVRSVSGEDLTTVEGNVGNKVALRTITNWRERDNIDGIGQRKYPSRPKKSNQHRHR